MIAASRNIIRPIIIPIYFCRSRSGPFFKLLSNKTKQSSEAEPNNTVLNQLNNGYSSGSNVVIQDPISVPPAMVECSSIREGKVRHSTQRIQQVKSNTHENSLVFIFSHLK